MADSRELTAERLEKLLLRVAALETFDTACCVDELLLSCEKGMAVRADPDAEILASGARLEDRPAGAGNRRLKIFGMDFCFHLKGRVK